jgi:hypothetical protein
MRQPRSFEQTQNMERKLQIITSLSAASFLASSALAQGLIQSGGNPYWMGGVSRCRHFAQISTTASISISPRQVALTQRG